VPKLGDEILRLMSVKGVTRGDLAKSCGVGRTFIDKLVNGERKGVGADVYLKLCDALGVPCEHFRPHLSQPQPEKPKPKPKQK
jgi:transcriptional regulator with XRE-family HTH domain